MWAPDTKKFSGHDRPPPLRWLFSFEKYEKNAKNGQNLNNVHGNLIFILLKPKNKMLWEIMLQFFWKKSRINWGNNSKSKILNLSKMVSETWNYIFRIQKIRKKQNFEFLSFLGTICYLWTAKMPKKTENAEIFAKKWNWNVDFRPETDKLRPICRRKVRSEQNSSQNFFYSKRTKIHDFISKKRIPPKKMVIFFGGVHFSGIKFSIFVRFR